MLSVWLSRSVTLTLAESTLDDRQTFLWPTSEPQTRRLSVTDPVQRKRAGIEGPSRKDAFFCRSSQLVDLRPCNKRHRPHALSPASNRTDCASPTSPPFLPRVLLRGCLEAPVTQTRNSKCRSQRKSNTSTENFSLTFLMFQDLLVDASIVRWMRSLRPALRPRHRRLRRWLE